MNEAERTPGSAPGRRQGGGCFALAGFSLLCCLLCIVLGVRCLLTSALFDCIGLLTVFPALFAFVALGSAVIGVHRMGSAADASRRAQASLPFTSGWRVISSDADAVGQASRTAHAASLPVVPETGAGKLLDQHGDDEHE